MIWPFLHQQQELWQQQRWKRWLASCSLAAGLRVATWWLQQDSCRIGGGSCVVKCPDAPTAPAPPLLLLLGPSLRLCVLLSVYA